MFVSYSHKTAINTKQLLSVKKVKWVKFFRGVIEYFLYKYLSPYLSPIFINTCISTRYTGVSGDAENRTRVQTSSQKAFYIFISFLIFDQKLIKNNPFLA